MASLKPATSGGQLAASASGYATSVSATTGSTSNPPAVNDMLVVIALDAYGSTTPTVSGGTGTGAWTVQGSSPGQPVGTVATKPLTAAGQQTVTATVPSAGMLYLFVFVASGYVALDGIVWGADNSGNEVSTRVTSTAMVAPALTPTRASTTNPEQPISAHVSFYDGTTTTPSITAPSGGTLATTSTTPATAGAYGTLARAYTYATVTTNAAEAARTATFGRAVYSASVQFSLTPVAAATPVLLGTLTDDFSSGAISATKWTDQSAGAVSYNATVGCAQVSATHTGTTTNYAHMRSAVGYTLVNSGLTAQIPHFPDAAGDTVNAQVWVQVDPASTVNRIGFEYVGASNTLVCRGQTGSGYAAIGTDVSIAYSAQCRWLRLTYDTTNGMRWYTSPDGVTWTLQRTLAAASVPSWCAGTNTLQASFETYRTTGTNDVMLVDNVNLPPGSAVLPTWPIVSTTAVGQTTWHADLTQATAVAAGYQDMNWNIDPSGIVTWPPPTVPAPYGRAGNAVQVRVPDAAKRFELQPDGLDYADGASIWEGFAFCLGPETDLQATAGSGYQVVWQLRPENGTGSPPAAIEVRNGALLLTGGYGRPGPAGTDIGNGGTYSYSRTLLATVATQTWYHVIVFVGVWSAYNSGRIDVWVNGVNVLAGFVPPPGTNYPQPSGTTPNGSYLKCGIYHDPANRAMTNYVADHKIGSSYTAVDPTQPVTAYGGLDVLAM